VKTECAHCKKKFLGWRAYAEHLLEKHPDDEIRCEWARYVLSANFEREPLIPRRRLSWKRGAKVEGLEMTPPDEVKTLRKAPRTKENE